MDNKMRKELPGILRQIKLRFPEIQLEKGMNYCGNDMVLYVLFMACSIFLFCSIVEMIRMLIIDSMFLKKISRYLESFQTKIDSKIDEILKGRHM